MKNISGDSIMYLVEYLIFLCFYIWSIYFEHYFWDKTNKNKILFKNTVKEGCLISLVIVVIDIVLDYFFKS